MKRWINKANRRIPLGSAAALLIGVTLMGQLLGFFRTRLIAANFTEIDPGSSDAFFAAFLIPDFFFFTISAGALGVAFMPFLADHLARGDKRGVWDLVNSLLNLLALAMIVIAVVIFVFADFLIGAVGPTLDPVHHDQAVTIMRLLALNPLFFTLSGILTSVQQTFGRFFFYAIAPIFYNLAIIASVYVFKDNVGIIGLGIGALVGGVIQVIVACLGLFGLDFHWRPRIHWRSRDFHAILRQLPSRSLDQGIDQVNSIVEVNRALALGKGPASYYTFATTLMNVPVSLIGTAISTAAFPRLVDRLAQNRSDLFRKEFLQILRVMIWVTMPTLVICFFCRGYLARLLYGNVSREVALIFGYLVTAIFFRIVYSIISRYFYAQKDTRTPLFVSIFAIGLNIYLAFSLAKPTAYGIAGLAIAQSLVAFSEVFILVVIMLIRDHRLLDTAFWSGVMRTLSVTGFSVLAAFFMISLLPLGLRDQGIITLGAKLGSITGVTFLVHLVVSYMFGLEEAQPIVAKVKQIILWPIRIQ